MRFSPAAIAAVSVLGGVVACRQAAAPQATSRAASDDAPPDAVAVVRLDGSMVSAVRVDAVALHSVPRVLRANGKVQFDERRLARILAPVAGEVEGLHASVGDHVRQDQPIFFLNSRDAAASIEDALDAHRDLDLAEKNRAMTQDLYEHQAASRFALEQAQNDVAKARARVDRAESALIAIGLKPPKETDGSIDPRVPVTSPIDGTVLERHVSDGQYVQLDSSALLTIADLSQVWVEADVFERDLHLVHDGEPADVTTTAYPDETFRAKVEHISDTLDPATRTVKVRFLVANPTLRLKPEMFANVMLSVEEREEAISVPAAAVITEGDRTFVYVAIGPQTFARKNVDLAPETKDSRRVLRGLRPGDRVVTEGAVLLRAQEDRSSS
jgi:cobalt-zinc-cadmium efflux system membrane fusion protein